MPYECGPGLKFGLDTPSEDDIDSLDSTMTKRFGVGEKVKDESECAECISTLYDAGMNKGGRCKKEGDVYKIVGCKKDSGAKCQTLLDKIADKVGGKIVLYSLLSLFVLSILLKMFYSGKKRRRHRPYRQEYERDEMNYR